MSARKLLKETLGKTGDVCKLLEGRFGVETKGNQRNTEGTSKGNAALSFFPEQVGEWVVSQKDATYLGGGGEPGREPRPVV